MRSVSSKITVNCETEKRTFVITPSENEKTYKEEQYVICFNEREKDGCRIGTLKLDIARKDPWDMTAFMKTAPVELELTLDQVPVKMTCMYMFNEWWTRPAFVSAPGNAPCKTQIAYLRHEDHYSCILPMVGNVFKTSIGGGSCPEHLYLYMESGMGGGRQLEETVYLMADGATVEEAVHRIFQYLHKYHGMKLREERTLPEMFRYLGWCSWDAFYKEIDEVKFRTKAYELIDKNVPVRWMLFDDGWLTSKEDMLSDYIPDAVKFPLEFDDLVSDIKERSDITWFGVWHAFGGYWAGVEPGSALADRQKDYLYQTVNGRLVPDPEKGAGFYRDWYTYLKSQQIDFVKVDGQSAVPIYFQQDQPTPSAARGMSKQMEKGAEVLDKNVINCMGMAMENILARSETGLSRNSDDFVPNKERGFAEHLLQNAYNALYHNEVYHCDWDMFWTMHPDAEKHALLRAISGGPVYFSDRIGETNPEIVKRLCSEDGRIPMMKRAAKPTEDMIFVDPFKEGILKLHNVGNYKKDVIGGCIAAFNLTTSNQNSRFSSADIPELNPDKDYWLYDYFAGTKEILHTKEYKEIELASDGYEYYILLPKTEESINPDIFEKYTGFITGEE